ncbi:MAG: class I SAM-dependent rRNA methyltransferase [Chloroflexota bacterium]|jgi:23S rRNA (cytosine1962-C5)-methyltransferase
MDSLAHIAAPTGKRIALGVKPAAERALRQGHPWLFDHSIRRQSRNGRPGDLAVVFDAKDRFLAIGLYDPDSPIRVRVLHHGQPMTVDAKWFRARLSQAFARRNPLLDGGTTGYRLLHGENDGLPGIVLDRYGDSGVVRLDTAAWVPHLDQVLSEALALAPLKNLVLRLSRRLQNHPETLHGLQDGQSLFGALPAQPVLFSENGLRFEADLGRGQKTGFFLDQRDNRATLEKLISQDGRLRQVLNVFAYTGAFSVYAARGGASHLTNIDASEVALAGAERNLVLNREQWATPDVNHDAICGDAFSILADLAAAGRLYDVVVIDPPSFANKQAQVPAAKSAYRHLVHLGLAVLRPNGLLVMSSCSSRIEAGDYFDLITRAAGEAGRPLLEVARSGHPIDHPIGFPEGAYLKCLFARTP